MKTNIPRRAVAPKIRTHEGAPAVIPDAQRELERAVLSCLLFENTFYEKGSDIADRIAQLVSQVPNKHVYDLAERARSVYNLRHVPLFLLVCVARKSGPKSGLGVALTRTIQRPDEITEFLSMYWNGKRTPIAAQVKSGLAQAFNKFSEFQLAKWNRDSVIKLRDAMFMVHPRPADDTQAAVWKKLAEDTLPIPDTWETALSAGADKKATWERLLDENKLGIMALLMNLRNMGQAKVDDMKIRRALRAVDPSRAFPYRFLTAARYAPGVAQELSDLMVRRCSLLPKLPGMTHVLVDVSGSMDDRLSVRGESTRMDAATSVAVCAAEACEFSRIFTFSNYLKEVSNVRGLALAQSCIKSQMHGGTYLGQALQMLKDKFNPPHRIIVITDEQAHDNLPQSHALEYAYIVNVAPYKPMLPAARMGYQQIEGWSDRLMDYIAFFEKDNGGIAPYEMIQESI